MGSTLALTDAAGLIQSEYTYEPFGKTTATGVASTNAFKYTGREDDGTGLYYYRARYYHPALQRLVSEDPIEFEAGDPNLYAYVENDPLNRIDPTGEGDVVPGPTGPRMRPYWMKPPYPPGDPRRQPIPLRPFSPWSPPPLPIPLFPPLPLFFPPDTLCDTPGAPPEICPPCT